MTTTARLVHPGRFVSAAPPTWHPPASVPRVALATAHDDVKIDPWFAVWELWAYHTAERRRYGLPDLIRSGALWTVSDRFARELARRHTLTHTRQDGTPFYAEIARALRHPAACSENAAMGQTTARQAVSDWMTSPGHRANILGPEWTLWGGAVASAADGTKFYDCDFA